jgi:hypothetical protein
MRRRSVTAFLGSTLLALTCQRPVPAGAETILIDGESYSLVRMSHEESMGRVPSFEAGMTKANIPGRILICISGLDLPDGSGRGNHSYGAYCLLSRDSTLTTVQVCCDEVAGHFRLESVDLTRASIGNLAAFVRHHCYGG